MLLLFKFAANFFFSFQIVGIVEKINLLQGLTRKNSNLPMCNRLLFFNGIKFFSVKTKIKIMNIDCIATFVFNVSSVDKIWTKDENFTWKISTLSFFFLHLAIDNRNTNGRPWTKIARVFNLVSLGQRTNGQRN